MLFIFHQYLATACVCLKQYSTSMAHKQQIKTASGALVLNEDV